MADEANAAVGPSEVSVGMQVEHDNGKRRTLIVHRGHRIIEEPVPAQEVI